MGSSGADLGWADRSYDEIVRLFDMRWRNSFFWPYPAADPDSRAALAGRGRPPYTHSGGISHCDRAISAPLRRARGRPKTASDPAVKSANFRPPRLRSSTAVATPSDSFPDFLARLRARDDTAARDLFERFARALIGMARGRFAPAIRHKVDPEDVVQSAYKSFFARYGDGNLNVVNWNGLWGLLTLITLRKCAERVEYLRAACRDIGREADPLAGP